MSNSLILKDESTRTTFYLRNFKLWNVRIQTHEKHHNKIFGNLCGIEINSNGDPLTIKEECFLGASKDKYEPNDRKKEEERKYRRGKPHRFKKTDGYEKGDRSDKNPVGLDGNILRCFRCDSTPCFKVPT